jgi:hypothetical protein
MFLFFFFLFHDLDLKLGMLLFLFWLENFVILIGLCAHDKEGLVIGWQPKPF